MPHQKIQCRCVVFRCARFSQGFHEDNQFWSLTFNNDLQGAVGFHPPDHLSPKSKWSGKLCLKVFFPPVSPLYISSDVGFPRRNLHHRPHCRHCLHPCFCVFDSSAECDKSSFFTALFLKCFFHYCCLSVCSSNPASSSEIFGSTGSWLPMVS